MSVYEGDKTAGEVADLLWEVVKKVFVPADFWCDTHDSGDKAWRLSCDDNCKRVPIYRAFEPKGRPTAYHDDHEAEDAEFFSTMPEEQ